MSKYSEVNIRKQNVKFGRVFTKDGRRYAGDMRCTICGKWFAWNEENMMKYILGRRWDERKGQPIHCGSSHCHDYHMRYLKHRAKLANNPEYVMENFIEREKRRNQITEKKAFDLFMRLKNHGVVA